MEAYETIMSSTRAPFSILPRPVDADGETVTTTGGADEDRYPLVPEETTIVAIWLQLSTVSNSVHQSKNTHTFPANIRGIAAQPASQIPIHS